MIRVQDLVKVYKVHERPPGTMAALRSLFHREYREVRAVDGVSFSVQPGERIGFLGPNGAGKTTTLKMLAGLLHPTEGSVEVAGHVPSKRPSEFLRSIMLVMGQKQQLIWDLPPQDTFELNRAIYGIPRQQYRQTLEELVELLGISVQIERPTRQLSLGQRMKCELAAALLHQPKVLFLDEPTIGLDITMQATVRSFIKGYNERHGATVVLTSHHMDDVEALCPRVVVISAGRIVFDGDVEALVRRTLPDKRVALRFSEQETGAGLSQLGVRVVEHEGRSAVLAVPPDRLSEVLADALTKLKIEDLSVESAPLEEALASLFTEGSA